MHTLLSLSTATLLALTLANCGGGGDDGSISSQSSTSLSSTPTSSSQSSEVSSSAVSSVPSTSGSIIKLDSPTYAEGMDSSPQIAATANGAFAVTWEGEASDEDSQSVFVQQFESSGAKQGEVFSLRRSGEDIEDAENSPVITAVGDTFIVGWDNEDINFKGAYIQKIANGGAVGEALLLEESVGDPRPVATTDDGDFVVVYRADSGWNLDAAVYMQLFDAEVNAKGTYGIIEGRGDGGPYLKSNPFAARVGNDGSFAACWLSGYDEEIGKIAIQNFDSEGNALSNGVKHEVLGIADSSAQRLDWYPQIAPIGSDGAYVASWFANNTQTEILADDTLLYLQSFDASGTPISAPLAIGKDFASTNEDPRLARLANNEFIVVWNADTGTSDAYIYAQKFDASLNSVGDRIQLGSGLVGGGVVTSVGTDGAFVIAWVETYSSYNGTDIKIQRFDANAQASGETVTLNPQPGVAGVYNSLPEIAAIGNEGAFAVTWWGSDLDNSGSVYVRYFSADE